MALQNYLTNAINNQGMFQNGNAYTGGSQDQSGVSEAWAVEQSGVPPNFFQSTVAVLSTDLINSTYLIAKNLPGNIMLAHLWVEADAAIATATWDVGIYDPLTGLAIASQAYCAAANWTGGSTKIPTAGFDGLAALTHEQTKAPIWSVLGKTLSTAAGCYDLVLTAHVAPTGSGSITFRGLFCPPG